MAEVTLDELKKKQKEQRGESAGNDRERSAGVVADLIASLQRTAGNQSVARAMKSGGAAAGGPVGGIFGALASLFRRSPASKTSGTPKPAPATTTAPAPAVAQVSSARSRAGAQGALPRRRGLLERPSEEYIPADESKAEVSDRSNEYAVTTDFSQPQEPVTAPAGPAEPTKQVSEDDKSVEYSTPTEQVSEDNKPVEYAQPELASEDDKSVDYSQQTEQASEDDKSVEYAQTDLAAEETPQPSTTPAPAAAASRVRTPRSALKKDGRYVQVRSMDTAYKGEDLSVAEAKRQNLQPERNAIKARDARRKAAETAEKRLEEIQDELKWNGPDKEKLTAEATTQKEKGQRALKEITSLGLDLDDEKMSRFKVQYLTSDEERDPYWLRNEQGRLVWGVPPEPYDTTGMTSYGKGAGWAAFVMSPEGKIYSGEHRIQRVHHSSFLAGGDVAAAGEIKVEKGRLTGINNKTGHYKTNDVHIVNILHELEEQGVKLSGVELWMRMEDGSLKASDLDAAQWLAKEGAEP